MALSSGVGIGGYGGRCLEEQVESRKMFGVFEDLFLFMYSYYLKMFGVFKDLYINLLLLFKDVWCIKDLKIDEERIECCNSRLLLKPEEYVVKMDIHSNLER